MSMKSRARGVALVGASAALMLALTGCSTITGLFTGDAPRDDEGNVTEGTEIDIFSMKVGDCIAEGQATGGETDSIQVVPCSEPHEAEVYHEFDLPDGEFPSSDVIEQAVIDECIPAFAAFVGKDYSNEDAELQSELDFTWYEPTRQSWEEADDRLIQCLVYDPAGTTTGSLKGANR